MNIKPKIIAFIFVVFCVATPFFAGASVGSQPLSLLVSVPTVLQKAFTSLYNALASFSKNITHPLSSAVGNETAIISASSRNENSSSTITVNNKIASGTIILRLGEKSVMVTILQWDLIKRGYLKGPASGVFGTSTQAAVEEFQKANNLSVTGYLLMTTSSIASSFARATSSFTPTTVGATGTQATVFQKYLIDKGYLKIPTTTAYFGKLTQDAIKKFQTSHGLPQTGIVNQATFAAMNGK